MTQRAVLKDPNDELRKPSEEVSADEMRTEDFRQLVDDMIETMKIENGVGIAAPQVGVHKRVIVVDDGNGAEVYINPRITSKSFRKMESEEGCLSIPGVWGFVKRHKSVKIEALDREGKKIKLSAVGFPGTIFQHEVDHLNGVLFIDKVYRYTKHPRL